MPTFPAGWLGRWRVGDQVCRVFGARGQPDQALRDPCVRLMRHARAEVAAFERAVVKLPEVVHTNHVTGNYDYLLQVEVAELAAYEDFHARRLSGLPGVAMVTSYVTMKT